MGAAITLAAWTDQEWATGTFGAGSFNIQSSVDGEEESFTDHTSQGNAATLRFDLPGTDNMAPNDTVAAPFVLRLDAATTYNATVELTVATLHTDNNANANNLTYSIILVDDVTACTPGATGTEIAAETQLGTVGTTTPFALTPGAESSAGAPVTLCFQVTAGENLAKNDVTQAYWEFVGTSVE